MARPRTAWLLRAAAVLAAARVPAADTAAWSHGKFVYERHCLPCHGRRGDGRGELAAGMAPAPRPFARGLFKFRSTGPGTLPTDDDLMRTIRGGLSGTAMPMFAQLADRDVQAVILYVKSLSPVWRDPARRPAPLPPPAPPGWWSAASGRPERAAAGARRFTGLCAPCHGAGGAGDGPAAPGLLDEFGQPAPPPDLRRPAYKAGTLPAQVFLVLTTGRDGTPMPSFAETLTDEERWELVAHLESLRAAALPPPTGRASGE